MTYGVPYSFVPGTKARADEVNANFIEVLNKIEETNSRIDDVNTQTNLNKEEIKKKLEEGLEQKAGLDLANLDSAGKAILNNKANATDLDGKWTSKSLTLVSGGYLGPVAGATVSFSLSSYLPADNNIYDVIFRTDIEGYSKGCYGLY
ncbi:MAG: hypothetical protein K2F57_05065, partial [Candidatus Gastranaerophilales bacterium]|nr:hypothetical protein [Candidatus Gastranaerophilales bacterium]